MLYTFEYDLLFVPAMPVVEIQLGRAQTEPTLVVRAIVDSGADATISKQLQAVMELAPT